MPRIPEGIRRHGAGWEANVRVNGQLFHRSFPLNTPPATMTAWRKQQQRLNQHNPEIEQFQAIEASRLVPNDDGYTYIYFARSRYGTDVKIGRALDPAQRLRELQTAASGELILIAAFAAHVTLEAYLHRRFAHLRTRARKGEWFRFEPDLIAFVHALNNGANPIELCFEDPRVITGAYLELRRRLKESKIAP